MVQRSSPSPQPLRLAKKLLAWAMMGCCSLAPLHGAGTIHTTDLYTGNELTLVLKNFNGGELAPSNLYANNSESTPTYSTTSQGYVQVSTIAGASDPKVEFYNSAETRYNVQEYNYVRMRQRANVTTQSELWPRQAVTPTRVLFTVGTSFTESSQQWANPTNGSITAATTGGFRWDPIANSTQPTTFDLDYIMVDRGRVIGFEFDTAADFQGWSRNGQIDASWSVSDGNLKGITTGGDGNMSRTGLSVDTSIYKYAEIRMRADAGTLAGTGKLQFFWSGTADPGLNESKSYNIIANDGQWHTYLLDFTNEALWAGTIQTFRVDIGTVTGLNFDIDYIRFREVGAVPEPGKSLLIMVGLATVALRRRRKLLAP